MSAAPGPIAAIDVGTNTTLLLIARPRPGAPADPDVLVEAAEITRLGRGIGGDGKLGRAGIDLTLAALAKYAELAAKHGATIAAVGTEALRRAPNANEFLLAAHKTLGAPVNVIDGDHEAALTFRAVAESFPTAIASSRTAVIDIGGGSTEIIVSDRGQIVFRRSLPLGSVRLHERHIRDDPPTPDQLSAIVRDVEAAIDAAGSPFEGGPLTALIGVAGTVTSLAAMTLRLDSYDAARVHGLVLTLADIDAQIARLSSTTQPEREQMAGLDPRRADVILAGALLLRTIARRAAVAEIRVSDRGIRWGLYYERAGTATGTGL
jgi:exopolyphosphatase/guanosine-5'-triphosphate,3'-diphosphate pyrophosphatase